MESHDIRFDDASYQANLDVIDGMQFCATLRIQTPLAVLMRHGEVFRGPPSQAPRYGSPAEGIWIFKPKSLREFGLPFEFPESDHASDIGPIKPKDYLPFLKKLREIVEGGDGYEAKSSQLKALRDENSQFNAIWRRLAETYNGFPDTLV